MKAANDSINPDVLLSQLKEIKDALLVLVKEGKKEYMKDYMDACTDYLKMAKLAA